MMNPLITKKTSPPSGLPGRQHMQVISDNRERGERPRGLDVQVDGLAPCVCAHMYLPTVRREGEIADGGTCASTPLAAPASAPGMDADRPGRRAGRAKPANCIAPSSDTLDKWRV
ncbi:hypothetical protein [Burkholderia sp. BE17]|uniref:hypothetical protein n=1 Tax=Burkholderia sp. BE17 TaxID=2656644 RepID=UPI001D1240B7|nr:hypothetical protein [Burkholderia sp. BE17]